MARKLYPPYIEGTIPAFYGDSLTIPYSMNRAVNFSEIAGFALKIKTVQNNVIIDTLSSKNFTDKEVVFKVDKSKFNIGQYYKVQLAFGSSVDEKDESRIVPDYFSTVGVIKYTTRPIVEVKIENENNFYSLKEKEKNSHSLYYYGYYSQKRLNEEYDETEKVYSYNFKVWDREDNLIHNSGELIHNSTYDDEPWESYDKHKVAIPLKDTDIYSIQYTVTTNNKMVISSPKYKITQANFINPEAKIKLVPILDEENGYVELNLKEILTKEEEADENRWERSYSGAFIVSRRKEIEENNWEELLRFSLNGHKPSIWKWLDFTVEQGYNYIYSIQQYSTNLISKRIETKPIWVDFEHAFLYDGERQLKIKYNPKVSSFKTTLLESKMETMGSKYPFMFKNGNVSYKDFPISGLISYLSDEENLFINDKEYILTKNVYRKSSRSDKSYYESLVTSTTDLIGDNYSRERKFKLEVLDWLNNGKPKLFRSPGEGNYIVRLMNISLSPIDQLGRLIHNFNCNAYEIDECNYDALYKHNFISNSLSNIFVPSNIVDRWASVQVLPELKSITQEGAWKNILPAGKVALGLDVVGLTPGDQLRLRLKNKEKEENIVIVIGSTGSYKIENLEITEICINENNSRVNGIITYRYKAEISDGVFGLYKTAENKEMPIVQVFGNDYNAGTNIIKALQDIKTTIMTMYYINIEKRDTAIVYANWGKNIQIDDNGVNLENSDLFYDKYLTQKVNKNNLEPHLLYQIHLVHKEDDNSYDFDKNKIEKYQDYYYDRVHDEVFPKHGAYLDGKNRTIIAPKNYSTKFTLDNNEKNLIDLNETLQYVIKDYLPSSLELGTGLVATLGYTASVVVYNFEEKYNSNYLEAVNEYNTTLEYYTGENEEENQKLDQLETTINNEYKNLLDILERELEIYKRENGLDE